MGRVGSSTATVVADEMPDYDALIGGGVARKLIDPDRLRCEITPFQARSFSAGGRSGSRSGWLPA